MSKRTLFVILVLAGLIIVLNGCKEKPASSRAAESATKAISEPAVVAPAEVAAARTLDFALTDHNGKRVKLSDYSGKIVVLEWLNYDCPFVKPHYEAGTFANLAKTKPYGCTVKYAN